MVRVVNEYEKCLQSFLRTVGYFSLLMYDGKTIFILPVFFSTFHFAMITAFLCLFYFIYHCDAILHLTPFYNIYMQLM